MSRRLTVRVLLVLTIVGPSAARGRDLYVDPSAGDDRANGRAPAKAGDDGPVKTIARGIKLAEAGDTVHLAPVVFRESAIFYNRKGEPGRPITLDGHGATLEGSDPLAPDDWTQVSPGLYRNDRLVRPDLVTRDDAVVRRWFFLFDGKIQHMGRTMKGPTAPLKTPEGLKPGEWTVVPAEHAFFVRIDPGRTLADCRIAAPVRSSAVVVTGDCDHIVVRNVTGTHVHNDGYNIHGKCRDTVFENIGAVECGDDGFSAHDDCFVRVDGFRSVGNSTGIANVGHSRSENTRVWVEGCLGIDLLFMDEGYAGTAEPARHALRDSVVVSSASRCLELDGSRGRSGPCRLELENVLVRREGTPGEVRVAPNSVLAADRVALLGVELRATGGELTLRGSAFGAGLKQTPPGAGPDVSRLPGR